MNLIDPKVQDHKHIIIFDGLINSVNQSSWVTNLQTHYEP